MYHCPSLSAAAGGGGASAAGACGISAAGGGSVIGTEVEGADPSTTIYTLRRAQNGPHAARTARRMAAGRWWRQPAVVVYVGCTARRPHQARPLERKAMAAAAATAPARLLVVDDDPGIRDLLA